RRALFVGDSDPRIGGLAALLLMLFERLERLSDGLLQHAAIDSSAGLLTKLERPTLAGRQGHALEAVGAHERAHTPRA
ncbi:hypothetical protein TO65_33750, partial [Pseudomonas aeruginosa]